MTRKMPRHKKSGKKSSHKKSANKKSKNPAPPKPPTPRPNTKITGERSEAAFLHHALNLNLAIAKPWGDSRRYDFIIDNGGRLWRVQTKCTECLRADAYETRATYTVGKTRAVYTRADIDFIAAHVVPLDTWYIIPVEVCTPAPMLCMYPHRKAKKMRLEKYKNAWFLLKLTESPEDGPITIQASAEEVECDERKCGAVAPAREAESLWLVIPIPRKALISRCSAGAQSTPKVSTLPMFLTASSNKCKFLPSHRLVVSIAIFGGPGQKTKLEES